MNLQEATQEATNRNEALESYINAGYRIDGYMGYSEEQLSEWVNIYPICAEHILGNFE